MDPIIPHKKDILFGKGTAINSHPGNRHLRTVVESFKPKFNQTERSLKRDVAREVVENIRTLGGRFLAEDTKAKGGVSAISESDVHPSILAKVWVPVENEKVIAKVLHRLREKTGIAASRGAGIGKEPQQKNKKKPPAAKNEKKSAAAAKQKKVEEPQFSPGKAHPTAGDKKVGTSIPTNTDTDTDVMKLLSSKGDEESIKMSSSFPVNPAEWINRSIHSSADGGKYLQSAVNLALVLTKHLINLHNTSADLKLNDLMTDNLIIFVGTEVISLDGEDDSDAQQNSLVVERVKFIFEDPLPMTVLGHTTIAVTNDGAIDPRSLCASLGNILLDLFSQGQSNSMAATTNNDSTNNTSTGSTQNGDNESQEGIFDLLMARFQDEDEDDDGSTNNCTAVRSTARNRNNESQDTIDSLDDFEDEYEVAAKRMAAVSLTSDSLYDQTKRFLVDVGAPLSICQLICDLLDTVNDKPSSNSTSHINLEQALWDLTQMKDNPQMFLFDRACPERALDDTQLFGNGDGELFGREEEVDALMSIKSNISEHIMGDSQDVNGSTQSTQGGSFLLEAAFLAGYAGSGKSCLLRSLINKCEKDKWFVLKCKFDSKSVPLRVIAKAFDHFFGALTSEDYQHDPSMLDSFYQVGQAILSALDGDSFSQLCAMIPNLSRISPLGSASGSVQGPSSEGAAGAAEKSLVYLINSLLQALCSSGRPVLLAIDDLQWSDSVVMTGLLSFDVIHIDSSVRQGLMIAGTYRSNEVKEGGDVLETINLIKNSDKANLTMLDVHGLSERNINQLISAKLGLPLRYTLDLAKLVHRKTKGNPFFVIQFLKTIIHNKMLQFSVRQRMWKWYCDTIDLQMISDGVAEVLTATFDRLPAQLMQTLKLISLFGNQIEVSTVDQINSGQQVLSFDMKPELDLAVKEGLIEKAGPLYAFSHDLIHQTLYNGMPAGTRHLFHKVIGNSLLECSDDGKHHSMHLLAVDQINIYCKDGQLSNEERSEYARANAVAAHYAMAGSSFEKAQSYVDMGIKLLQPCHWEEQYSLSLDLYEVSASLCYMCGNTAKMSSCLDEIIFHAKTFKDSLNAAAMLARLLTSSHEHNEAITNCLDVLATLGEEEFPPQPDLAIVQNKLSEVQPLLLTLTADRMKALPTMADTSKLQAMKFFGMLCEISLIAAPMLLPLLSVRMMELTLQFGFCSDSILGISYAAFSMFLFTDDVPLAYQVGKVGVMLREESQHKHLLRSRLVWVWEGGIKSMIEPLQAVVAEYPSIFKSAMRVGDVQNAMFCRYAYCVGILLGGDDLPAVSNHFALCIQQSAKYQQHVALNMAMAWYQVLVQLSGQDATDVKSFEELYQIGKESNNTQLLFNVIMSQMCVHFCFRDYPAIMKLCAKHPAPTAKRLMSTLRCEFEGIAALNLARQQPYEPKYRAIGEKAVKDMSKLEQMNKWTYGHKSLYLQAELHYLNQDYEAAEHAYIASIKSAKDHKFINEEAMANELFGVFCIENQMGDKGMKHLRVALDLYKQWGAMSKAADLEQFIESKTSFCIEK